MKPIIAHCRTNFLPITETFIKNQILNLENFDSIILTREISGCSDRDNLKIFSKKSRGVMSFFKKMSHEEEKFFIDSINKNKVEVLHTHFGSDAWYFLDLKKKTELPLIVSFYGYDAYQLPKRFFGFGKIILRQVFKNADKIIVPSQHMKEYLVKLGCEDRKMIVLSWGIKIGRMNKLQDDSDKIKFISIGRMTEKKGQIYLLKAFKEILDRGVDAGLTIVGTGQLKEKLTKTVDKLGICARVTLIDRMSNNEVVDNLRLCDVYIQPSVIAKNGDQEGVPTAIMEAFGQGLPVISTIHSGIPEIVENGKNGILVPEKDTTRLADAMEKLAKDQSLRKEFGIAGKKTVEEKFDINRQIKKLEEVYSYEINRINTHI